MHSWRSGLPGPIAHLPRLTEAGESQPAWITLLTTEHYNLQMQRVATISEANGRASVFLGALSAGLIALGFGAIGHRQTAGTVVFETVVLSSLAFLGLVAFVRCLEVAIDDWEFGVRISRLRAAYARLIPELAGVLAMAAGDEEGSIMFSRWRFFQKMLSVAGSIALITSVVIGADVGVLINGLDGSLAAAIGGGAAAGGLSAFLTGHYQWDRWCLATPGAEQIATPDSVP